MPQLALTARMWLENRSRLTPAAVRQASGIPRCLDLGQGSGSESPRSLDALSGGSSGHRSGKLGVGSRGIPGVGPSVPLVRGSARRGCRVSGEPLVADTRSEAGRNLPAALERDRRFHGAAQETPKAEEARGHRQPHREEQGQSQGKGCAGKQCTRS